VEPLSISRRLFFKAMTFALGAAAFAASGFGLLRFLIFSPGRAAVREAPVEALGALRVGVPHRIAGAHAWFVKTLENSAILVLDDRCPHLGCRYDYHAASGKFRCPCHGSEFDLAGNVLKGPARRPPERLSIGPVANGTARIVRMRGDGSSSGAASETSR
jgi:nitrite reductase/ring-hydroxylating ferredoxin subunit